jgi:hypothetical protein
VVSLRLPVRSAPSGVRFATFAPFGAPPTSSHARNGEVIVASSDGRRALGVAGFARLGLGKVRAFAWADVTIQIQPIRAQCAR